MQKSCSCSDFVHRMALQLDLVTCLILFESIQANATINLHSPGLCKSHIFKWDAI